MHRTTLPRTPVTDNAAWLALGHADIGCSDLPRLMGHSYAEKTLWDLWKEKRIAQGAVADLADADERIWWGKEMQDIIGKAVARRHGWNLIAGKHYVQDTDTRAGATIDFSVEHPEWGAGIVETKNRDWFRFNDMYTDDDCWMYDKAQLAHQLLLAPEAAWGAVAICVGGNELKVYTFKRTDPAIVELLEGIPGLIADFWQSIDDDHDPDILDQNLPSWHKLNPAREVNPE